MKVLVATDKPFAPIAINGIQEVLDQAKFELVKLEGYTQKQELLNAVADVDAIIIRSDIIDAEIISAAKQLKVVVRAGAGYDNVDLNAASAAKVVVMNTPGQNANAVAELAVGFMIFHARGHYNGKSGSELKGKKLGIHGYGNIGRNLARIAKGIGMSLNINKRTDLTEQEKVELGVDGVTSVEDLYSICNYISINVPLKPATEKMVNRSLLERLPKNAVVINTARAEVINEDDLMDILATRPDIAYLSDVKPARHEEFASLFPKNYFCTPKKMGAQTEEANTNAGIAAAKQIVGYLLNGDTTHQVNL